MKYRETEELEFKKSTSELKEAVISMVAMLNRHGKGEVYFGIKNDGIAIGQEITSNTLREISKSVSDNIEPKIYPKIKEVEMNKKKCIFVRFTGSNAPYFAYGRAYMRIGDENKQLSEKELEKIILEKTEGKNPYDKQPCEEAELKDISVGKVKSYLKNAGLPYSSVESSLKKLGLIRSEKILNSAILFFAKKPETFLLTPLLIMDSFMN